MNNILNKGTAKQSISLIIICILATTIVAVALLEFNPLHLNAQAPSNVNVTPTAKPLTPINQPTPTDNPQTSSPTRSSENPNPTINPTSTPKPAGTWHISTIEEQGIIGAYSSLALDSNGRPHVAYSDSSNGALKYASWNGSSWNIQTLDKATFNLIGNLSATSASTGSYVSLVLDSNDFPHISYSNNTSFNSRFRVYNSSLDFGSLKYAWWDGTTWNKQTVALYRDVKYTSLALDQNGNPLISFCALENNYHLKLAKWNGAGWTIEIVDSAKDSGLYSSLALDSAGNPHISYLHSIDGNTATYQNALKYASWTWLTGWQIETIAMDASPEGDCSLVIDANNVPHVSFESYQKTTPEWSYSLSYASLENNNWNIQNVDPSSHSGRDSSLSLDSKGYPHISYLDSTHFSDLKYAEWNGTLWNLTTIETEYFGYSSSLILDSADNPRISYYDYYAMDLKYAEFK
jgi:hypothetical protein